VEALYLEVEGAAERAVLAVLEPHRRAATGVLELLIVLRGPLFITHTAAVAAGIKQRLEMAGQGLLEARVKEEQPLAY
jgi:hypothetical protein